MARTRITTIHYGQTAPVDGRPIFYLAGPTRPIPGRAHWHDETADFFRTIGMSAILCSPMPHDGNWHTGKIVVENAQKQWQFHLLAAATVRVFWFPFASYMAYTEFGFWCTRGLTVAGLSPDNDVPEPPLDYAALAGIPMHSGLHETLQTAINLF